MDEEKLKTLVSSGFSLRMISKEMNICLGSIRYYVKKLNLQLKNKPFSQKRLEDKKCSICGEVDPSKFSKTKFTTCKKCHNQYTVRKVRKTKKKIIEYFGGSCKICGYSKCDAALDLHHIDPKSKMENFKTIKMKSWDFILEELKKCILLCKNCHSELHYSETWAKG